MECKQEGAGGGRRRGIKIGENRQGRKGEGEGGGEKDRNEEEEEEEK